MDDFKEFQGKSLDEAIHNACIYFDTKREKLEIDIVQDAKSGIFGLVGVRKAIIRAKRMASVRDNVGALFNRQTVSRPVETREGAARPAGERKRPAAKAHLQSKEDAETRSPARSATAEASSRNKRSAPKAERGSTARASGQGDASPCDARKPSREEHCTLPPVAVDSMMSFGERNLYHPECDDSAFDGDENRHEMPFEQLDQNKLISLTEETARRLIAPILGDVPLTVEINNGHVDVHVDCGEHSGLLIGREGQTLSALQYLSSRIVSAGMQAAVRVQFNAGDYRERQDERLRELACVLAERVRTTGRSCSTRPMSSYHRRIVHLALQNSPDVQTRSSGEGALKRVIVQKRKPA